MGEGIAHGESTVRRPPASAIFFAIVAAQHNGVRIPIVMLKSTKWASGTLRRVIRSQRDEAVERKAEASVWGNVKARWRNRYRMLGSHAGPSERATMRVLALGAVDARFTCLERGEESGMG